jgi:AraC-like DNA-binding protein
LLRPEWLFEVVNRLQPFAAPTEDALIPDRVFELFSPESDLEHQLKRHLLACLKEKRRMRPGPKRSHPGTTSKDLTGELRTQADRVDAAVQKAQLLLQRDFAASWSVERIARRVGCNRTDLEIGFQRYCAHTVHSYLILCRVDAAKLLLKETAWRVGEVAKAVGCRSKVSLHQHFRRTLGMTPDQYRRRWMFVAPNKYLQELSCWGQDSQPL